MKLILILLIFTSCVSQKMSRYLGMHSDDIMVQMGLPDKQERVNGRNYYVYVQRTYNGYRYTTFGFNRKGICETWNVRIEPTPPETINVRIY